ncbi:MAG TPA: tRNA preQ1(34) S-adenosylmethionine ribosyltransferase-isomerase QueA [Chloroflexota bacterium]|nr:tRNA preQ1(34) S-adenosylmethionine ribosyltransferase-isomerase QueA [Chloroflexota bacterium]
MARLPMELLTSDFDYELPPELIAQTPTERRDESRLLVLNRADGSVTHTRFARLGTFLRPGDALVANRSRVIHARLEGRKSSGGAVEILLLSPITDTRWHALCRPSRRLRPGAQVALPRDITATLEGRNAEAVWTVSFAGEGDVARRLLNIGRLPLPPYIRDTTTPEDRYQTVYADRDGSVAAPTAGLHFTPELLEELRGQGVETQFVTLHVGPGTFRPVTSDRVADHDMHAEWGEVPEEVAERLNAVRGAGGRIVAVGTTSTRLLESAVQNRRFVPFNGMTNRFIVPGYRFQAIDALITNFHLPRSTLLMLVSALAGRETILRAYEEAIREKYRFYSFGDAMLIL